MTTEVELILLKKTYERNGNLLGLLYLYYEVAVVGFCRVIKQSTKSIKQSISKIARAATAECG